MIIEQRRIILRDGRECVLRSPGPEDAGGILELMAQSSGETPFLSRYPEERLADVEQEEQFLSRMAADERDTMICALVDGRIVGNAGVNCLSLRMKYRHRAVFGITVLKEYWGLGIGSVLLQEAEGAAVRAGFEQIELEVAEGNARAAGMYEKAGFAGCGKWPRAFRFKDGSYMDLILMVKMLTSRPL